MPAPQQADYFLVPLLDGSHGIGQVLEAEGPPEGSLFCALSRRKGMPAQTITPLSLTEIVAFCFLKPALIADNTWPLGGFDQIPRYRDAFDYPYLARQGFPDVTIHDPAVIEAFVNACHGLYPWDAFGPLFDEIKRPDVDKPAQAAP